jgi:O-antigen ligase
MTSAAAPRLQIASASGLSLLGRWFLYLVSFGAFFIAEQFSLTYSTVRLRDESVVASSITSGAGGGGIRPVVFLVLGGIGALFWVLRRPGVKVSLRGALPWLLMGFIVFATLSIMWGEDSSLVIRRVGAFILLSMGAYGFAHRFTNQDVMRFTMGLGGLMVVVGFLAEVALGSFQPWVAGYRFYGIDHANNTGVVAAMVALAAIALGSTTGRRKFFWTIATIVLAFLILTKSRAAALGFVVGFWAWWFLGSESRVRTAALSILVAALVVPLILMVFEANAIHMQAQSTLMMGRKEDAETLQTFTGRLPLWEMLFSRYIDARPLLGYGYDSFWNAQHVLQVSMDQGWAIYFAHSGYVDTMLNLGVVGTALLVLIMVASGLRAYRFYRETQDRSWLFMVAIILLVIATSFFDTIIFAGTIRSFIVMIIMARLILVENDAWAAVPESPDAMTRYASAQA